MLVDSEKKVDKCGICGGDGTQCQANKVSFVWTEVPLSHCSAPCGGGYRMVRYVCQNNVTNEPVQDELCNVLQKPQPKMASCNVQACPPRYLFQSLYPLQGDRLCRCRPCKKGPNYSKTNVHFHIVFE